MWYVPHFKLPCGVNENNKAIQWLIEMWQCVSGWPSPTKWSSLGVLLFSGWCEERSSSKVTCTMGCFERLWQFFDCGYCWKQDEQFMKKLNLICPLMSLCLRSLPFTWTKALNVCVWKSFSLRPEVTDSPLQQYAKLPTNSDSMDKPFLHVSYKFELDGCCCRTTVRSQECLLLSKDSVCKSAQRQRHCYYKNRKRQKKSNHWNPTIHCTLHLRPNWKVP